MTISYSVGHAAAPDAAARAACRRGTAGHGGRRRRSAASARGAWLKHAAVAQDRIEDAGQAAGEGDDGDVLAAAGRDVRGPGVERLGLGGATAEDGDSGLDEEPARAARAGLASSWAC